MLTTNSYSKICESVRTPECCHFMLHRVCDTAVPTVSAIHKKAVCSAKHGQTSGDGSCHWGSKTCLVATATVMACRRVASLSSLPLSLPMHLSSCPQLRASMGSPCLTPLRLKTRARTRATSPAAVAGSTEVQVDITATCLSSCMWKAATAHMHNNSCVTPMGFNTAGGKHQPPQWL